MFFNDVCELESIAAKLTKEAEVIPAPKNVTALTDQHIGEMLGAITAMDPSQKWVIGKNGIESITPFKMDWIRLWVRLRQVGIAEKALYTLTFDSTSDESGYYIRVADWEK